MPNQRLLSAGNSPTATGAASLESLNPCLHTTNSSIRACRITTSCQADLTQVPGWREGGGEQSVSPRPRPHPAWPPDQDRAQNPHTPFSPSESPWQEEQSSLVLKVSRLSSLLTANQLQEYRKRNEDCSLVDSLMPNEFGPQEEVSSSHLHWHLKTVSLWGCELKWGCECVINHVLSEGPGFWVPGFRMSFGSD